MKKQFQSKSVPRGTRTIWRYLGALFILFTFAIGNVMAGVTIFSSVSQETTDGSWTITGSSNSASNQSNVVFPDPAVETGFPVGKVTASTAYYCKLSSSGDKGAKLSTTKRITIGGLSAGDSIVVYWFATSTTSGKLCLSYATGASAGSYIEEVSLGTIVTKQLYATSFKALTATDIDHIENGYSGSAKLAYISSNGPSPYVYAVKIISGSVTKHTVTYKLNGGTGTTPTQADVAEGAKFTLHNGTTGITAPTNKDFDGWHDGTTKYAGGAKYTMGTSNVILTAQWVDHVAKYTVKYMDGTTVLGTEEVNVTEHPAGLAENPKKDCYTFAAWSPALSSVSGEENDEVEVNATWTPVYSSSATLISDAVVSGKPNVNTVFAASNIVSSITFTSGNYEFTSNETKPGYYGYKDKNSGDYMKILVQQGKQVQVLFGNLGANPTIKINGADGSLDATRVTGDNAENTFTYKAISADALISITMGSGTNTLKKVDIAQLYTATRVDAKSDGAGTDANVVQTTLPTPTAISGSTFTGWKANADVKDSEDNTKTEGTVLAAGTYTLLENTTFTAQWAGDVYTVKFMDGETVLDTKVVEVGSHPTDIEHPTKPLYIFATWQLSGSDVVLDDVTGTKDATVILTARWTAAYALDVNFKEAATQELGVETALNTYHYASDAGDISFEEKGLKIKTNAARFYFNVAPGKVAEIKFGNISGATYSVDGGAAETLTSSQLKATYSASAQSCVMTMTTAAYNIVEKVTIHDPYQVTFDANEGDPVASQYGYPSITLPSASKGTDSFLGWFIGEDKIGEAGDSYTPTANVELVAHWEAVSTDTRIKALTYAIGAGTPVNIYEADKNTFNVVLPYAKYDAITVATSPNHANASIKDGAVLTVSSLPGSATFTIVAQSGAEEDYTVNFSLGPKDGVCLIKGNVGNDSFVIDEEASLLSGTTYKNAVKSASTKYPDDETGLVGWKFNSKGAYLGFTLDGTETFQENDVVEAYITYIDGGDKLRVFTDHADAAMLKEGDDLVLGVNKLLLPATSTQTLYLYRSPDGGTYQNWNPRVAYFAVYRPMMPTLTAITIDGRDGEIDALDDKHFSVTIPYEADLANLTIVPTIVWNAPAAENSIVVNDGGAWVEGDNTYKLTDKDGDYTVYTLTLTRDVLKHTVSFNTHGGSAVASMEIEHNTYLTSVPNDPSKEDYIFQYWSLTDGGEEVDVTTVKINEDKEFHAVWVSDGGIKLLDGSTVNHTNFITAVTATETVEFKGNTVNYAKFSGTCGSVSNVKDLTRVIAYNATTNKTKIRISAHNNSTSARNILVKGLVEGADAAVDLATIALGNKEDKVSDWIEFNNAADRTIYIMVGSSAGDVYFTQVKVIESGETPMKQAGEAGYSLNLNKGRFFGLANADLAFEGLNARLSGDYTALNSGYAKLNATSMSFTVASDMNLVVTTNNSKTYYVTKGAAGTDNETAKTGVSEFDLTAGTWYITAGSSEVQFTNIAFELPKAETPTITTQPTTKLTFDPGDMTATVVAAEPSDGGVLSYQWYNASNDEAVAGATEATLTTTTEGTYYVIVTNSLAGHQDVSVTSDEAELGYRVTNDATLSALSASAGTLDPVFDKNEENYSVNLAMGTTVVPTLTATATMNGYANVAKNEATEFVNYEAVSTVVVTSEDGTATKTYTVHFYVDHLLPQVDVTESTTWDWTYAATAKIVPEKDVEILMANIRDGEKRMTNDASFNSQALLFSGQEAYNVESERIFAKGGHIKFNVTVPGIVKVEFSDNGNNNRRLKINNYVSSEASATKTDVKNFAAYVMPGEVTLMGVKNDGTGTDQYIRISKIEFIAKATPDYSRDVTNNIGTLCVDHNVLVGGALGATFYQIASRNELYNDKIDFEEVLPNEELKAGEPYIFKSTTGKIELFYGATVAGAPVAVRGMIGSFANTTLDITEENKSDILYIAQNKLWNCEDLVVSDLEVVANRAYIVMSDVPTYAEYQAAQTSNQAPRRRVTLGKDATQTTTGVENLNASEQPIKMMIDGKLYILRGEKMFDATGRLVK